MMDVEDMRVGVGGDKEVDVEIGRRVVVGWSL